MITMRQSLNYTFPYTVVTPGSILDSCLTYILPSVQIYGHFQCNPTPFNTVYDMNQLKWKNLVLPNSNNKNMLKRGDIENEKYNYFILGDVSDASREEFIKPSVKLYVSLGRNVKHFKNVSPRSSAYENSTVSLTSALISTFGSWMPLRTKNKLDSYV